MKAKTLQEFADGINAFLKANPGHKHCPVLTASDDEGNNYNRVYYDPSYDSGWEVNGDEVEGVCVS